MTGCCDFLRTNFVSSAPNHLVTLSRGDGSNEGSQPVFFSKQTKTKTKISNIIIR